MKEQKEQLKLLFKACAIYANWQSSISKESGIRRETLQHLVGNKHYLKETDKTVLLYYKSIKFARVYLAEKRIEAYRLRKALTKI